MSNYDALKALVGTELPYFGMDNNCFKLGSKVYEAIEDPSDGYRSYLEAVEVKGDTSGLVFSTRRLAKVKVTELNTTETYKGTEYPFDGIALVDVTDGHVWAEIGTGHGDEYYPSYVCRQNPKPPPSSTVAT